MSENELIDQIKERMRTDRGEAEALLRDWIQREPSHAAPHRLLARVHIRKGLHKEAHEALTRAVALGGGLDAEIERALLVPPIPESSRGIELARRNLHAELDRLLQTDALLTSPVEDLYFPHFYYAYQGKNDRLLQQKIANLLLKVAPSLSWTANHCKKGPSPGNHVLKVGICSNNLRNNSVGLFFADLIEKLNRREFETILFRAPSGNSDSVTRRYQDASDLDILLSPSLESARRQIAEHKLDILFYPDMSVHPLTTCLAYARLAPVQLTSWGHPVTSGVPTVDYYISSRMMEPENGRDHYTEKLVTLPHFPCTYKPPKLLMSPVKRDFFGLPEHRTLYCCGHQAFKLHPDFDEILGNILRRDRRAELILINGWGEENHGMLLAKRVKSANPDVADRIQMLPRLSYVQYLSLSKLMDVHLDPILFGGGRTTFDLLCNGNPVVTWPGPFQRGRVTGACLEIMGVPECIAGSREAYAERAVTLGNDRSLRRDVVNRIKRNSRKLIQADGFAEEIGAFFKRAFLKEATKAARRPLEH